MSMTSDAQLQAVEAKLTERVETWLSALDQQKARCQRGQPSRELAEKIPILHRHALEQFEAVHDLVNALEHARRQALTAELDTLLRQIVEHAQPLIERAAAIHTALNPGACSLPNGLLLAELIQTFEVRPTSKAIESETLAWAGKFLHRRHP